MVEPTLPVPMIAILFMFSDAPFLFDVPSLSMIVYHDPTNNAIADDAIGIAHIDMERRE